MFLHMQSSSLAYSLDFGESGEVVNLQSMENTSYIQMIFFWNYIFCGPIGGIVITAQLRSSIICSMNMVK